MFDSYDYESLVGPVFLSREFDNDGDVSVRQNVAIFMYLIAGNFRGVKHSFMTSLPALHGMCTDKPRLRFRGDNFCRGQPAHKNYECLPHENYLLYST